MRKHHLLAGASVLALLAAGVTTAANADPTIAKAKIHNSVYDQNATDNGSTRPNLVTGSYTGASGVMHMQQNEGNNNAIGAATTVQANFVDSGYFVLGAAEVKAKVRDNEADQFGGTRTNNITNSFGSATGVATVQQNNGDNNSIGAATTVQYNGSSNGTPFTKAEASVNASRHHGYEHRRRSESETEDNSAFDKASTRTNTIGSSFNGFQGVATVQENNGNNNAIGAATSVAADIAYNGDISADATVNSTTEDNFQGSDESYSGHGSTRTNTISNSFNTGASGEATVQQNNGDNNQIGAATVMHVRTGSQVGNHPTGNSDQDVKVKGSTTRQDGTFDEDSHRTNTIDPAFVGFTGVATLQQNNGSANAISAATSVVGNLGGNGTNMDQEVNVSGNIDDNSFVKDLRSTRINTLSDSFTNSAGVISMQQNNGDVNVMGIGTAVAFNLGMNTANGLANSADQSVNVSGKVDDAWSLDLHQFGLTTKVGLRRNAIDNSFGGAAGLVSIQQNNGSQNVMGIGNALIANVDANTAPHKTTTLNGADQYASTTGGNVENNGRQITGPSLLNQYGDRNNEIGSGSFDNFSGIASIQQNNGDNNVIGTANAVAMALRSGGLFSGANAEAETSGYVIGNDTYDTDDTDWGANRNNAIGSAAANAFNTFQGIANVQQNNGNNNVMGVANTVLADIGVAPNGSYQGVALGSSYNEAESEAYVSNNQAQDSHFSDRANSVNRAFNSSAGMMTVQQNNGNNNFMGASNSVTAALNNPNITTTFGPVASIASLSATVSGNSATTVPYVGYPGRTNTISASYVSTSGVMVTQQNNGDNNAIQSAVSVTANLGNFAGGNFLNGLHN